MRISVVGSLLAVLVLSAAPPARADWPQFRGPFGNGHAQAPGDARARALPLRWSESENVKWKIDIPHRGWSTPVVLSGQVWLTTATPDGHDFFALCVDAETGKIRHNVKLFHTDNPEPLGNNVNCYASPSPAIEPGRVYVNFGSYGTACLDTATAKVLWQRRDLPCRHYRGPGSSIILWQDLLILTMDGVDVQYVVALDKRTGRTVWKSDRSVVWDDLGPDGKPKLEGDLRKAFSTPLIIEVNGKPQLLSIGSKAAYAYDPRTGREIWKVHFTPYSNAPSPLFHQGMALITTGRGRAEVWAVRADGSGDVTETHVAWKAGGAVPQTPSPILVDGLYYMLADDGMVTCLDVGTGQQVWRERIPGSYAGSPIFAGGRLYCFNQTGKATVLKPGRAFEVLATNTLDEGCMASPAVSGKALFVRTRTRLYRIEAAD